MDDCAMKHPDPVEVLLREIADQIDPRPWRRIIQESGSAFQIGSGNALEQADGVS